MNFAKLSMGPARLLALTWVSLVLGQSATLGACTPPAVTVSPAASTLCPGYALTFAGTATGTGPFTYQWSKNGVALAATNSALPLLGVSSADAGTYRVVVKGPCGSATNSATLAVNTALSATPLTNLVRFVGTTALFSTTASGSGPLSYLWQKNGALIGGATTSSLVRTNLSVGDSGTYTVVVSGPCNSVTNSAILTVDSCFPAVDVVLVIDRSLSMSGTPYTNARQACSNFVSNLHLTTNADQAGLASYNSAASLDQKLTNRLSTLDAAIAGLPAASGYTSISLGLQTGQAELLSGRHNPQALPVLVLLSDGQPTGSDTPSNALYQATLAKNTGTLVFTVGLGTNVDGNLMAGIASSTNDYYFTTNSAQLTSLFNAVSSIICRPPTNIFTVGPSNLTVCAGLPAVFGVSASGCDSFAYQWDKNGVRLPGQTGSTLVIPSASQADAGVYAVEVTSACQSVTNSAMLTVNQNLAVSSGPANQTTCPGTTAYFSVNATGAGLTYQWYKGVSSLTGRTAATLTLTNVSLNDAGTYGVVVSAACGNSVSNSATLTIIPLSLACPPLVTVTASPGLCGASTVNLGTPTVTGVCGNATLTNDAPAIFPVGTNTVTWKASDNHGNSSTCQQQVIVLDNQPPALSCPVTVTVSATPGLCGATNVSLGTPSVSDNCGSVTLTNDAPVIFPVGTNTVTWKASDNHGNSSTCQQLVIVLDNEPPALSCPAAVTVSAAPGLCGATNVDLGSPMVSDSCGSVSLTNDAPAIFPVGTNTVTWKASDNHGNSSTCQQLVIVLNAPITITAPLTDQVACVGTSALLSIGATGNGLTYTWWLGGAVVGTGNSLLFQSLGTTNAGTYQVVVSDVCGTSITNWATLTVNPLTPAMPLVSVVRNLGDSVTFTTVAAETWPLSYVWKKNGVVLAGQSTNSLTLSHLSAADGASYTVEVSGACNTVVQTNVLTMNQPPVVTLLSPATGTVLLAPATLRVLADAYDLDGTVTNVEFLQAGLGKVGETNGIPYGITLSNLAPGTYTFTARATDNLGAQGLSAPVSITVVSNPPLSIISALRFDPQSGLFIETVRVSNPTPNSYDVRVSVYNLGAGMSVFNASGTNNGVPYVQTHGTVPSGGYADLVIEYHVTTPQTPNPTLVAALVDPSTGGGVAAVGVSQHIDRALMLSNKTFLLEFNSVANRSYYIQYSSDLRVWQTVEPAITGTGARIQWIDNGEPKTASAPATTPRRYYRLILAQ